ncbi:hypothetical protein [Fluviispira sanaruensis]|uniref:ABC-type transport auxiliary lipoprotein component domain-containing protein n=1 Tax=Fluviispira sanaruensis TaxID=2493639 RepID=A0A4P2VMK6_FLUSA|nr:hypothetical protein [Fluviispira sanaruensis]BBH53274.1 hypothetical protein JCM31447_17170 [Fluviispira sanaruensis]
MHIIFILFLAFALNGCVVGFANMHNHVPEEYTKVYIPAANDFSIYGGNSSRLSYAIRSKLSERTDFVFSKLEDARWALQVNILDRKQSITAVDSCKNPSTPNVASGAYSCAKIHPESLNPTTNTPYDFNKPTVSPSSEQLSLVVDVKAIDLNTGNIMWVKRYSASNISPTVFNEIGDTDGRTLNYMQQTPDLHALRYQEAVDNAVKAFSTAIANDVQETIFKSMQQKNSISN